MTPTHPDLFARGGGYESPQTFNDGLVSAIWVGAAVVGVGAAFALLIPRNRRSHLVEAGAVEPLAEAA